MFGLKQSRFTEISGWYGMLALIVAYGLASFGVIESEGLVYQILNLAGGIGLIVVAASKGVVQSVLLNVFWILIGIAATSRIFL